MESPFFSYNPEQEPPFSIFIEHKNATQGHWEPAAFIKLTGSLRTSGFLFSLPPEDLRNFLLLLTFLTANGSCAPTLSQVAEGLRMSEFRARLHLKRLTARRWLDQPIVLPARYGGGVEAYMLMPGLLPVEEEQEKPAPQQAIRAVPREQVIALSRQRYARPRAEVERMIEAQLREGRRGEESDKATIAESNPVREQLIAAGLEAAQADYLIAHFDSLRIQRQLQWLPYRAVKNPAGFLIAAIKDNYEAPATMRAVLPAGQETPGQPAAESQPIELQAPTDAA